MTTHKFSSVEADGKDKLIEVPEYALPFLIYPDYLLSRSENIVQLL